jgi:hypothetical protein
LNPRRASAQRSTIGLSQPACTQRRRIHARARGRRSAPARRRVRAASRGPDDGPLGGGEPPHRGRLSTVGAG